MKCVGNSLFHCWGVLVKTNVYLYRLRYILYNYFIPRAEAQYEKVPAEVYSSTKTRTLVSMKCCTRMPIFRRRKKGTMT